MHIKAPRNLRGYTTTLRNGVRKIIPYNGRKWMMECINSMTITQMIFKIRKKKQIKTQATASYVIL